MQKIKVMEITMSRLEEVELTNMCMICDGKGNVLVQDKKNHPTWHGWNFSGELKSSSEGDIFWYPLSQLYSSDKLIDGFDEMLSVFTKDEISEVFYERLNDEWNTVFC